MADIETAVCICSRLIPGYIIGLNFRPDKAMVRHDDMLVGPGTKAVRPVAEIAVAAEERVFQLDHDRTAVCLDHQIISGVELAAEQRHVAGAVSVDTRSPYAVAIIYLVHVVLDQGFAE